ncbi:MAG: hypothetical protein ABSE49_15785 [Polyangiaceae bacterium]
MSRDIVPLSSPYRSAPVPVGEPPDPLCAAERIAVRLLLGWALLRVGVCSLKSLDPEGFIALVIVVTAVKSLARSLA